MSKRITVLLIVGLLFGATYSMVGAGSPTPPGAPAATAAVRFRGSLDAGGDFLVASRGFSDKEAPAVADNADDNEFLVVWEYLDNLYGRIYSAQGVPRGTSFIGLRLPARVRRNAARCSLQL